MRHELDADRAASEGLAAAPWPFLPGMMSTLRHPVEVVRAGEDAVAADVEAGAAALPPLRVVMSSRQIAECGKASCWATPRTTPRAPG